MTAITSARTPRAAILTGGRLIAAALAANLVVLIGGFALIAAKLDDATSAAWEAQAAAAQANATALDAQRAAEAAEKAARGAAI